MIKTAQVFEKKISISLAADNVDDVRELTNAYSLYVELHTRALNAGTPIIVEESA